MWDVLRAVACVAALIGLSWVLTHWMRWRELTGRTVASAIARERVLHYIDDGEWHHEATVAYMNGRGDCGTNQAMINHLVRCRIVERDKAMIRWRCT